MGLRLIYCFTLFSIVKAFDNETAQGISITPDNVFNGVYSECFLHLSYSCLQRKTLLYLKELNNLSEVSVIGDYVKFVKINKSDIEEHEQTKPGDTDELAFRIDEAVDDFFDSHVLKFYALGRNITMPQNEAFVGRKRKGGGGGGGGGHGGGMGHGGGGDDGGKKKMMMMAMMCMKMKLMMMVPAMMGMMGMMSFKGMMFSMMSFMISKMMLLMKILEKKGGGGGLGGGGGGGLDGGWQAGGAGGGAWMPAGGQDYAGGGGGGGYDANGQWQSRSIVETLSQYKTIDYDPSLSRNKDLDSNKKNHIGIDDNHSGRRVWEGKEANPFIVNNNPDNDPWQNTPEISFVKPVVRYNNNKEKESKKKPVLVYKRSNVNFDFNDPDNGIGQRDNDDAVKRFKRDIESHNSSNEYDNAKNNGYNMNQTISPNSSAEDMTDYYKDITNESIKPREKRGIVDLLQNSYIYWINKVFGINNNRRTNFQKYKIVNGIKYVYYPYRMQKPKMPKAIQPMVAQNEDLKPLVAVDDFNKGEIVEGGIESRMMKKKFHKMKDTVNDTMDDNPWE